MISKNINFTKQYFGNIAGKCRAKTTLKCNIRDYAIIKQLLAIANIENFNTILLKQKISLSDNTYST